MWPVEAVDFLYAQCEYMSDTGQLFQGPRVIYLQIWEVQVQQLNCAVRQIDCPG